MENKSSFQFKGYQVVKSFIEIQNSNTEELKVEFEPKGVLNNTDNLFTLELRVLIFDKEKNINIEVIFKGNYSFIKGDKNLKSFIFTNAPALLFPYVRAYITALTALSGILPVTLPTMNLSSLKDKLEENIIEA